MAVLNQGLLMPTYEEAHEPGANDLPGDRDDYRGYHIDWSDDRQAFIVRWSEEDGPIPPELDSMFTDRWNFRRFVDRVVNRLAEEKAKA